MPDAPTTTGGVQPPADTGAASKVLESIDNLLMGITEAAIMRAMAQAEPCVANAWLREQYALGLSPRLDRLHSDTRQAAEFLPTVIGESLSRQGRLAPGVEGGTRLGEFLFHSLGPARVVPPWALTPLVLLGPIGIPLTFQWIEDHLPSGVQLRSGAWKQSVLGSGGIRVSAGVFYQADDQLRGNAIRDGIQQWIQNQVDNVQPAGVPSPRTKLVNNVGTYQGSGPYGLWQEGDPILPGSKLATAGNVETQMLDVIETSDEACAQQWVQQAGAAGAATVIALSAEERAAADARASATAREQQMRNNQIAIVGGLGIAALLAVRAFR
jgi:hypothetical protein